MKKLSIVALILTLSVGLVACGNKEGNKTINKTDNEEMVLDESKNEPNQTNDNEPMEFVRITGYDEDIGEGTIFLVNESGNTKDNERLYIMYEDDAVLNQIGYEYENMDGSLPTIIYLDAVEIDKKQLGTGSGSITLEKENLQKGIHNVEFMQKDGDLTVFYHLAQYEVK